MITQVGKQDLAELESLVGQAVRQDAAVDAPSVPGLLQHIFGNLRQGCGDSAQGVFLKYVLNGRVAGVILVQEYWNLSGLFVHPRYQGRGIGRELLLSAIKLCKLRGSSDRVRVDSSANAVGFYRNLGFVPVEVEPSVDYRCVPLAYYLP